LTELVEEFIAAKTAGVDPIAGPIDGPMGGNPGFWDSALGDEPGEGLVLLGTIAAVNLAVAIAVAGAFEGDVVGEVVDGRGVFAVGLGGFGASGSIEDGVACPVGTFLGGDEVNDRAVPPNHRVVAGLIRFLGVGGLEAGDDRVGGGDGFVENNDWSVLDRTVVDIDGEAIAIVARVGPADFVGRVVAGLNWLG
jgi:hypothetical protein